MKMFDAKNKVVLITGAANGIGAAIVREFLREGVKYVTMLDLDEESGVALEKELTKQYGEDKIVFIKCDITDDDQLDAAYKRTVEVNGYIDVVINNAGIANESFKMYKKEININFTALVTSSLKALELMRADKGGKGGTIVNVSSVSALALLSPSAFIYGATKAAVLHFTASIGKAPYYTKTKVRTMTLCFGSTDSKIGSTFRSFDEYIQNNIGTLIKYMPMQTCEFAAERAVEAFKVAQSGSIWLIWSNIEDITNRVNQAYDIMAGDIFD